MILKVWPDQNQGTSLVVTMVLISRSRWTTTGSARVWNVAMLVLHNFWGLSEIQQLITWADTSLRGLHLFPLKISMVVTHSKVYQSTILCWIRGSQLGNLVLLDLSSASNHVTKFAIIWAVVVAHWIKPLLPTPEARVSNPVIVNFLYRTFVYRLSIVVKRRKWGWRGREWPFLKKRYNQRFS